MCAIGLLEKVLLVSLLVSVTFGALVIEEATTRRPDQQRQQLGNGHFVVLSDRNQLKLLDTRIDSLAKTVAFKRSGDIVSVDYYFKKGGQLILVWLETRENQSKLYSGQFNLATKKVDQIKPFVVDPIQAKIIGDSRDIAVNRHTDEPVIFTSSSSRINVVNLRNSTTVSQVSNFAENLSNPAQLVVDTQSGAFVAWIEDGKCIYRSDLNNGPAKPPLKTKIWCLNGKFSNNRNLEISAIAVEKYFCYFVLSSGEVYRVRLTNFIDNRTNRREHTSTPTLIVSEDDYSRASHSIKYTERSPSSLSIMSASSHIDVYVGDNSHHMIFHLKAIREREKLTTNEEEEDLFTVSEKNSSVLSVERRLADFVLLKQEPSSLLRDEEEIESLITNTTFSTNYKVDESFQPTNATYALIRDADRQSGETRLSDRHQQKIKKSNLHGSSSDFEAISGTEDDGLNISTSKESLIAQPTLASLATPKDRSGSDIASKLPPQETHDPLVGGDGSRRDISFERVRSDGSTTPSVVLFNPSQVKKRPSFVTNANIDGGGNGPSIKGGSSMNEKTDQVTVAFEVEDDGRTSWFWCLFFGGSSALLIMVVIFLVLRVSDQRRRANSQILLESQEADGECGHEDAKIKCPPSTIVVDMAKKPRTRSVRSFSGRQVLRAARQQAQPVTAVAPDGTVCIEDLGGFGNPGFDFAFDFNKRACDVCDYKDECSEKGVCLSTFRLLSK